MKWYTAYLHRTEEILACGTAQQVAEALGMKMGSFYTAVSRSRAWKNRRYDFVIEEISEDEFKKEYGRNEESLYPILAAARGCNVIVRDTFSPQVSRSAGQYIVTLDRGALTMSKKTVAGATTYMNNW